MESVSAAPGDPSNAIGVARIFEILGDGTVQLAFLFGAIVVALYAGKRLGELISPPQDEEYDFTKMLTLATMVGQDVYRRSFILYVFLLEFCYIVLCTFQPLAGLLLDTSNTVVFDAAAWPLTAALVVVGILPTTPVVVQVEQSIRRFAHQMAQIPDEFYNRVTALSNEEIEVIISQSKRHRDDVQLFYKVRNLLSLLDFGDDEATRRARKCVGLKIFGRWTLRGKDLWSQSEYQKYRDVTDLLKPRFEELTARLSELIDETAESGVVKPILAQHQINLDQKYELMDDWPAALRSLISSAGGDDSAEARELERLRTAWEKISDEFEVAAKRHIALFSIIARNDRRALRELGRSAGEPMFMRGRIGHNARFDDPVLRHFAGMIRSKPLQDEPWFNSLLSSALIALASSVFILSVYRIATENAYALNYLNQVLPMQVTSRSFTHLIRISIFDSAMLVLSFWLAGAAALSWRAIKISDDAWMAYYGSQCFPTGSYVVLTLCSTVAAFPVLMIQYILFYAEMTCAANDRSCSDLLLATVGTNIGISMAIGIWAVGLCIITDAIRLPQMRDSNALYAVLIALPAVVNALVLAVSDGYLNTQPLYFGNQVLLFLMVSSVMTIFYGRNLVRRIAPKGRHPANFPDSWRVTTG